MTTIAQVRQVVQPLLQRHSDLALVGRYLIIKPVNHFTRGVFIDRSMDSKSFTPSISVCLAFTGRETQGIGWGDKLIYLSFDGLDGDLAFQKKNDPFFTYWQIDRPENIKIMLRVIEVAIQSLRAIDSLEHMVAFAKRDENNFTPLEFKYFSRLLMALALGDLDEATQIIEGPDYRQIHIRQWMDHWHPTLYPALLAEDRQELAKFLHEMEAKTVRTLKLQKYWEPTPFPLELQG